MRSTRPGFHFIHYLSFFLTLDLKRASPISSTGSEHRCATIKSSGILPGRLLNVPLPSPNLQYHTTTPPPPSGFDDSGASSAHGSAYHWDCSDWVRRSHNPLPNITEVPGSEVPDSSSFHSNESNESQQHKMGHHIPPSKPPPYLSYLVDPIYQLL